MRALKFIGLGILGIVVLLFLISLLLPSEVKVERSTTVNASADVVFNQVNNLRSWETWSPWLSMDPEMKLEYSGSETGVGSSYTWTSSNSNVGNGTLTIVESTPSSFIKTKVVFDDEQEGFGTYTFEESEGTTTVTWAMTMDMGANPVGKYFGLMMDGMIGANFEKGLAKLKDISENAPKEVASSYPKSLEAGVANAASFTNLLDQDLKAIASGAVTAEANKMPIAASGAALAAGSSDVQVSGVVNGSDKQPVTGAIVGLFYYDEPTDEFLVVCTGITEAGGSFFLEPTIVPGLEYFVAAIADGYEDFYSVPIVITQEQNNYLKFQMEKK